MIHPNISDLYHHFKAESGTLLSDEQFVTLLTFFPALLVVTADGKITQEETIYIEHIAKAMAQAFRNEYPDRKEVANLKENFYADLSFLIKNIEDWEVTFLNTLKIHLEEMPEVKDEVYEVIHMFAETDEGATDKEKKLIARLEHTLELL